MLQLLGDKDITSVTFAQFAYFLILCLAEIDFYIHYS